ncbi:MAG: molybdopterin molybdotransferase MoeA [Phycisphaeraceae bacterium]|nr:molybdopterin molybdotransferase MoeA [Phycisphaeraceae bacterium]
MISPQGALDIVLKTTRPLKMLSLPLADADGFCLAQDVRADRNLPPTDRSAMDGYALRAADVERFSGKLELTGEAAAGQVFTSKIKPGKCVRIFTGAVVPSGIDTVVKVEHTQETGGVVTVLEPVASGDNIRRQGEETAKGQVVLTKGTILGPIQVGLCATLGKAVVKVYGRPRVAVISTGTEIVAPDQTAKSWQIRDANGPALCAALKTAGCGKAFYRIAQDNASALRKTLRSALKNRDVVLLSGGVSVGRYDLVPQVIQEIGAKVRFHKVAIKPGKPVLYATFGRNQHIFGLPGNPLSALTGLHEFVLPAIRRMAGVGEQDCHPSVYLPLAETLTPRGKRLEHVLVRIVQRETGPKLVPVLSRGSADLVAANLADGVVLLPRDKRKCLAGKYVEFRSWRQVP